MDPVSLVAASLTIATKTASSLKDIYDYYKSYRNVPDSIQYLESTVNHANDVLAAIKQQGIPSDGAVNYPNIRFDTCEYVLQKVGKFAEKHHRRIMARTGIRAHVSRVRFTWDESEIKTLRKELERQVKYLITIHQLASSGSSRHGWQSLETPIPDGFETRTLRADDVENPTSLSRSNRHICEMLIEAADKGDVERIREYSQVGAKVNYHSRSANPHINGYAPIHLAVRNGHLGALKELIKGHANVNIVEPLEQETALHIAASKGHLALVRCLIANKANIDAENIQSETSLVVASTEDVQLALLDAGANANAKSADGFTALHLAILFGHVKAVRKLVEKGANVNARDPERRSPLLMAYSNTAKSEEEICAIIEIIATRDIISNEERNSLLFRAIEEDRLQVVQTLLNTGIDIFALSTREGMGLVHFAARRGSARILAELLQYRDTDANLTDAMDRSPLHHAVAVKNIACVRVLLDANAALKTEDPEGFAPLHRAFSLSSLTMAEMIIGKQLAQGISINLKDSRGRYPIHLAKTADMVELWNRYEGHVDKVYKYEERIDSPFAVLKKQRQRSIIHYSVLHQAPVVVEALLGCGAKLDQLDDNKRNPMEALCATEGVWKSADGKGLSRDRVDVLMILTKRTGFSNACRTYIASWKDKELQAALEKELPWRSLGQMAATAVTWTLYTGIPTTTKVVLGGAAVINAVAGIWGLEQPKRTRV